MRASLRTNEPSITLQLNNYTNSIYRVVITGILRNECVVSKESKETESNKNSFALWYSNCVKSVERAFRL